MRTFDWVFFPQLPADPDDEQCRRLKAELHDSLDRDHFGEADVTRSGPGIAVLIRVLDDATTDDAIRELVTSAWSRIAPG